MDDPVLRRPYVPTDIYSPFDSAETATLRTFALDTRAFVHSALFKSRDRGLALFPSDELHDPHQLTTAGEEAVRSVVGLFRSLFEPQEAASFDAVVHLLCRHAIQSEAGVEVLEFFRALKKWRNEELRRPASRTVGSALRRRDLIDLFLYGAYLHKEPSKVERLESLSFEMKMSFLDAVKVLRLLYDATERELVQPVLETPSLVPSVAPAP